MKGIFSMLIRVFVITSRNIQTVNKQVYYLTKIVLVTQLPMYLNNI